ncbi:SH3 domain-containing protein [Dongia sp.]|uniref:SH3 domain-containing protein n=1 Tax=Dongia sp. TaxID=1977262 RepID=UPI003751ECBE
MKKIISLSAAAILAALLTSAAQAASPQAPDATGSNAVAVDTAEVAMVVSHSSAHVRKDPNTKSPVLATLKKGAKVDVIAKTPDGKWAHVKSGKVDGYIALALLKAA